MAEVRPAPRALLFVAITAADRELLEPLEQSLVRCYGPFDDRLGPFDFAALTDYYRAEMGSELYKEFLLFRDEPSLEALAGRKLETNQLEADWRDPRSDRRRVNIDPGYLTLFNFCLLTTKGFSHRVYLGDGIFAEVTLLARDGRLQPLPWTYPDYRSAAALAFLEAGRQGLKRACR